MLAEHRVRWTAICSCERHRGTSPPVRQVRLSGSQVIEIPAAAWSCPLASLGWTRRRDIRRHVVAAEPVGIVRQAHAVRAGECSLDEFVAALQQETLYVQRPERPGVFVAELKRSSLRLVIKLLLPRTCSSNSRPSVVNSAKVSALQPLKRRVSSARSRPPASSPIRSSTART